MKTNEKVPTPQEWEDMNSFTKRDLEWELDFIQDHSNEEQTSSGMFDH